MWAIRVALFLVCAVVSAHHMDERWVIGPLFGLVVLAWHLPWPPPVITPRHGAFLLASTVIYALVAEIAIKGPPPFSQHDALVYQAVAVGTVLLPLAHRQCLEAPWDRTVRTMVGVYVLWVMAMQLLQLTDGDFGKPLVNSASVWQALYLYFMFAPPSVLKRLPGPPFARAGAGGTSVGR